MPWERILVSVPPELMERLEAWEDSQPVPPSRSSILRVALEEWLDEQEADEPEENHDGQ